MGRSLRISKSICLTQFIENLYRLFMKTPKRFVPTLTELRALSAVSRHKSVSAAAEELNVSQPTVSYHIKRLEERWETKLFRTQGRSLVQTEFAQDLLHDVYAINESIDKLSQRLNEKGAQKPLSISTSSSFASIFLVPRIEQFRRMYPQTPIRVNVANRFVDFSEDQIDIAIRLLTKPAQTMSLTEPNMVIPLPNETMRIVCSPQYLDELKQQTGDFKTDPTSILGHAKIIDEDGTFYWSKFLSIYAPRFTDESRADLSYNNADLVLQSAIAGQGIAIVRELYVADAISKGELVEPFTATIPCERMFQFVLPETRMQSAVGLAFIDWLGKEIQAAKLRT